MAEVTLKPVYQSLPSEIVKWLGVRSDGGEEGVRRKAGEVNG